MKILFNTHPFAFQNPGGGEVIMEKLKEALHDRGHQVDFFSFRHSCITDYDIVHHFSAVDTLMWSYYKKVHIPFVLTPTYWPRSGALFRVNYKIKFFLKRLLGRHTGDLAHLLQYADMITPTSDQEAIRLGKLFSIPLSKMTVIPNGVSSRDIGSKSVFQGQFQLEKYSLFVGNISPVKNLHLLIEQFNQSGRTLVIVGDALSDTGDYLNQCKKMAQKNIIFLGRLPLVSDEGVDIDDLYRHAQAVIIPSEFETCSLVALEAGIRGTPVLLTKNGGTKSIFADKLWYIDPARLEEVETLLQKIESGEFDQEALRQFIESEYSWESIAYQLEEVYNRVLKEKN